MFRRWWLTLLTRVFDQLVAERQEELHYLRARNRELEASLLELVHDRHRMQVGALPARPQPAQNGLFDGEAPMRFSELPDDLRTLGLRDDDPLVDELIDDLSDTEDPKERRRILAGTDPRRLP